MPSKRRKEINPSSYRHELGIAELVDRAARETGLSRSEVVDQCIMAQVYAVTVKYMQESAVKADPTAFAAFTREVERLSRLQGSENTFCSKSSTAEASKARSPKK